jgi:6,7-dimethyl-8-ribityllumazine synthase
MLSPIPTRPRLSTAASNRIVIVASRYNWEFVEPMVTRAVEELSAIEPGTKVEVVHAPGSFEIPFLAANVLQKSKPDAVICLGVIFKGETGHADLIAASVSDALCQLSVEKLVPVIHGVLMLNDQDQAKARCLGAEMNRGTEAARAAVEILRSSKALSTR